MSVSQVNTTSAVAPAVSSSVDGKIEVPFKDAFSNLEKLAAFGQGQWFGVDMAERKLAPWGWVAWAASRFAPDQNIASFVGDCVKTVLTAVEFDKLNRPRILVAHESIGKGLQAAIVTYKGYPVLSDEFSKIWTLWNAVKPDTKEVMQANMSLIQRSWKLSAKAPFGSKDVEMHPIFQKNRVANESAVAAEGDYPRDVKNRAQSSAVAVPAQSERPCRAQSVFVVDAIQQNVLFRRRRMRIDSLES